MSIQDTHKSDCIYCKQPLSKNEVESHSSCLEAMNGTPICKKCITVPANMNSVYCIDCFTDLVTKKPKPSVHDLLDVGPYYGLSPQVTLRLNFLEHRIKTLLEDYFYFPHNKVVRRMGSGLAVPPRPPSSLTAYIGFRGTPVEFKLNREALRTEEMVDLYYNLTTYYFAYAHLHTITVNLERFGHMDILMRLVHFHTGQHFNRFQIRVFYLILNRLRQRKNGFSLNHYAPFRREITRGFGKTHCLVMFAILWVKYFRAPATIISSHDRHVTRYLRRVVHELINTQPGDQEELENIRVQYIYDVSFKDPNELVLIDD